MSMETQFKCDRCGHAEEAWDDGNPYYLDERGKKHYAYHPDHELLERCIGNDSPHVCLACARKFMQDSRAPRNTCPRCASLEIVALMNLDACRCPWCKSGVMRWNPDWFVIS